MWRRSCWHGARSFVSRFVRAVVRVGDRQRDAVAHALRQRVVDVEVDAGDLAADRRQQPVVDRRAVRAPHIDVRNELHVLRGAARCRSALAHSRSSRRSVEVRCLVARRERPPLEHAGVRPGEQVRVRLRREIEHRVQRFHAPQALPGVAQVAGRHAPAAGELLLVGDVPAVRVRRVQVGIERQQDRGRQEQRVLAPVERERVAARQPLPRVVQRAESDGAGPPPTATCRWRRV